MEMYATELANTIALIDYYKDNRPTYPTLSEATRRVQILEQLENRKERLENILKNNGKKGI